MKNSIKRKEPILLLAAFAAIVLISSALIIYRSKDRVVINEVCSSNVACCMDANGEYPDWIELYNPSSEPVDISGYIIKGSVDRKKDKYTVPDGTILPPGAFFLFDPGFSLPSAGYNLYLFDGQKSYVDHVSVPKIKFDTTYARSEDGGFSWETMSATPGYSNAEADVLPELIEGAVTASAESGFYAGDFDVTLRSSNWGRTIYYTLDGSDPVKNGTEYTGSIHIYDRTGDENVYSMIREMSGDYMSGDVEPPSYNIDKCTVVRAVAKDYLGRYTDVSTYTYFVGFDQKSSYDGITVVSAVSNPDGLFSHEDGIMVLGVDNDEYVAAGSPEEYDHPKANYSRRGRTSEREASIEIFDENHNCVLSTNAGFKVKGLSSRMDVQKSFSVIFRKAYGGKYREEFATGGMDFDIHSVALDKCGSDTDSKMMDVIMEECMKDTGCATKQGVPCCLFLDGEYWGFYWLTERFDNSLMADKYGVAKENVYFKDESEFTSGDEWGQENFDRDSIIDYYAGNVIAGHDGDWPYYNVRFWGVTSPDGTPYGDGLLRPVIFDMNSISMIDPELDVLDELMEFYPFADLSSDEQFRRDLVERIDEMSADEFEKNKMVSLVDSLYERMKPQMILDKMRFSNCSMDEAQKSFDDATDTLRTFWRDRWDSLPEQKDRYLNGN